MHIDTAKSIFRDSDRDIVIDKDDILAFAKDHFRTMEDSKSGTWNGRQIRNAFQTAIALAEMDATIAGGNPHLKGKQFEVVAKTSQDFDDCKHCLSINIRYILLIAPSHLDLRLTQGGTSARLAKQHKLRHDEFKSRNDKGGTYKKTATVKSRTKKKKVVEESSSSSSSSSDSSESSESEEETKRSKKKGKANSSKKDSGKGKKKKQESSEEESSESEEPVKEKKKKSKRRDGD